MLEFEGVSKRFSRSRPPAVRGLTLALREGEVLGLVGLNGAGKSTTIRIGAGVALPNSGSVFVDGRSLSKQKVEASRQIGWVPEESVHDSTARPASLLRYYSAILGSVPEGRIEALLAAWGMTPHRNRRIHTLSLGMRRRLSLAAAELGDPRYYLLDEVFNGLDPEAVVELRTWIQVRRAAGCGLLLSSHNLRELSASADRVAVLHAGRLLKVFAHSELFDRPARAVRVTASDLDEDALRRLGEFGSVARSADGAVVTGENIDSSEVARVLVLAGYHLHGLRSEGDGLEELFLELVRGAAE